MDRDSLFTPDLNKPDLYAEGWYAAHADRLLGVKLVTAWTAPGAYGRGYRDGWHSIGEETMNECMDYPDDKTHLLSTSTAAIGSTIITPRGLT